MNSLLFVDGHSLEGLESSLNKVTFWEQNSFSTEDLFTESFFWWETGRAVLNFDKF